MIPASENQHTSGLTRWQQLPPYSMTFMGAGRNEGGTLRPGFIRSRRLSTTGDVSLRVVELNSPLILGHAPAG